MTYHRTIFTVSPSGKLSKHQPRTPENEDEIQRLIAEHSILVTGGGSDADAGALLIQREKRIPDRELDQDTGRWSIDHVYLTRKALPVLVEVKQASDTRLRRHVVGQLMEYAANAVMYWPEGSIRASFEERLGEKAEAELRDFLEGEDAESFWSTAESNLREGRIRLVVLADSIPDELARIIEFLNGQMRAEVVGIELQHYASEDGTRTYVPRVIGQSEQTKRAKQSRIVDTEANARRRELYEPAVQNLVEFTKNTGNTYLTGITDEVGGGQWVIYPKSGQLELEYIIRGKCSAEDMNRQKHIADVTGFILMGPKVYQGYPYDRVESEGIVAIFEGFRDSIRSALASWSASS